MAPGKMKALGSPDLYTIGWIAALPIERAAAASMLDEEHAQPEGFSRNANDKNSYTWGRIGDHNIVIASLKAGVHGLVSASATASTLLSSLPSIRLGLLVGIGGGIPRPDGGYDIRLGDVIVSQPDGTTGGVCQYDFMKAKPGNRRQRKGFLAPPPDVLLHAVANIQSAHELRDSEIPNFLEEMQRQYPKMAKKTKQSPGYVHQGFANDRLYQPSYEHVSSQRGDCQSCEVAQEVKRDERESVDPEIHYGTIASGNTLVKDGVARDRIVAEVGEECICFEMEAAGLMNEFPCLVIRGVCDYADSHKNDQWQRYASATAAAYAKELLAYVPDADVQETKRASEILQSVDQKLGMVQQASQAVDAKVESIILSDRSQKLRQWLAAPDPNTNANHARELRHEGTGTWLLETSAFKEWMFGTNRHLWLRGMAGCGKTVLSTTILDHLSKTDDRMILSFFFDFSDTAKQTKDSLLRSMALQLYQRGCSSVAAHLNDSFRAHQEGDLKHTTATLEELVDKLLKLQQRVVIFLDALDESTTRHEIILWIKHIHENLGFIQMFYTSREEAEFTHVFPRTIGQECCLSIDKEATDTDIASYVSARLQTQPDFTEKTLSGDVLGQIRKKVGNGANGMFRWAACQLDSLARSPSLDELEQQLDSLPLDLPDTYRRMLDSIPSHYRERTMRLLQFLVFSEQPLTLKEGVEIFATEIQGEQPCFKTGRRLFNDNGILRYCSSLVSLIDTVRLWKRGMYEVQELHLAHFSVKEYLMVHAQIFNPVDASIAITKTCLTYLMDMMRIVDIEGGVLELERNFPLATYAAEAWLNFAVIAEASEASGDISTTIISFLQQEETSRIWIHLQKLEREFDRQCPEGSGFYHVCATGLKAVVKSIIDEEIDINKKEGGVYGNPLQAASYHGHLEIVRLLILADEDINAKGGYFGNALQAACFGGCTEIAKLLIDNGAHINAEGGTYGNALQAACFGGCTEIAKLLIDSGAHVNAEGGIYRTALHAACHKDHTKIAQLLIDHDAYIDAEGGRFGTALQIACREGHVDLARLLIKHNARINKQNGNYGNALVAASSYGHIEIVELLLSLKADINAGETYAGNPLLAACQNGHLNVVRLLLKKGADPQTPSGRRESPLTAACSTNEATTFDIVQLLLDHGADINFKSDEAGTPLQAAVRGWSGNHKVITLLLDRGADVNSVGGRHGTALQIACTSFHPATEIVKLLIDRGADLNEQGSRSDTPLFVACDRGHEAIFYFLVASGADIKTMNTSNVEILLRRGIEARSMSQFRMVASLGEHSRLSANALNDLLQHACHLGYKEGVEALLDLGAEINAQGSTYDSALHAACEKNHMNETDWEIVHLLLEKGADFNIKLDTYGGLLQRASLAGEQILVQMLIDFGADVNALGPGSTSAIYLASRYGRKNVVSTLLIHQADISTVDESGMTPLHGASSTRETEIVTMLLRHGSDIEAKENEGRTPLHLASLWGYEKVVNLLLDEGSPAESTDTYGQTPLHLASQSGCEEVVKILMMNGVNAESTDTNGQTPLHLAIDHRHEGVVEILIMNGVNCEPTDVNGQTPLHLASRHGDEGVVEQLMMNGVNSEPTDVNGQTPLHLTSSSEVAELLLENGAHADSTDNSGQTALHLTWSSEVAELLLENGAHADSADNNGQTPLHVACQSGRGWMAELFIESEANIELTDGNGWTPLALASLHGRQHLVELLLENGADTASISKDGRTPLHLASQYGREEAAELLIKNGANIESTDENGLTPLGLASLHGRQRLVDLLLRNGANNQSIETNRRPRPLKRKRELHDT